MTTVTGNPEIGARVAWFSHKATKDSWTFVDALSESYGSILYTNPKLHSGALPVLIMSMDEEMRQHGYLPRLAVRISGRQEDGCIFINPELILNAQYDQIDRNATRYI